MSIKKPSNKQLKVVGVVVGIAALIALGVAGTLSYQNFISNVKAQGVQEFKTTGCDEYAKDGQKWLECDVK